jgi:hypothetical protein
MAKILRGPFSQNPNIQNMIFHIGYFFFKKNEEVVSPQRLCNISSN